MFEKEIKRSELGIRVVERSGRTIKSLVQRSNHSESRKCVDSEKCMVCKEQRSGGKCHRENVGYDIVCKTCYDVYRGESSRNAFSRGQEHVSGLENKTKDSVLWRHINEKHENDVTQPQFKMTVTSTHTSALDRQIMEAVVINNTPRTKLLNKKNGVFP